MKSSSVFIAVGAVCFLFILLMIVSCSTGTAVRESEKDIHDTYPDIIKGQQVVLDNLADVNRNLDEFNSIVSGLREDYFNVLIKYRELNYKYEKLQERVNKLENEQLLRKGSKPIPELEDGSLYPGPEDLEEQGIDPLKPTP